MGNFLGLPLLPAASSSDNSATTVPPSSYSSSSPPSSSLEGFCTLPEELRSRIVALACINVSRPSEEGPTAQVDVITARSLASVSLCHRQANAMLWKAIKITRPTALIALWEAVVARPELALRIESLHIGNDCDAPVKHDPEEWRVRIAETHLRERPPGSCMCDLFRWAEEAEGRPWWWPVRKVKRRAKRHSICLSDRPCMFRATINALKEIERSLGIDLRLRPDASSGSKVYEAQEAWIMYFCHMGAVEQAAQCAPGCDHTQCFRYPSLTLVTTDTAIATPSATPPHFDANAENWVLTRGQVLASLAAAGSHCDNFDHPLRIDCSNFDLISLRAVGGRLARGRPAGSDGLGPFTFTTVKQGDRWVPIPWYDGSSKSAVRCLISLTPRLSNLALTGYLSCALDGPIQPKSLRSLSLGPPRKAGQWEDLVLKLEGIGGIKRLQILGLTNCPRSVPKLDGLERLEELRWSISDNLHRSEVLFLKNIIDALVGRRGLSVDEAVAATVAYASELDWVMVDRESFERVASLRARTCKSIGRSLAQGDDEGNGLKSATERLVDVSLRPEVFQIMLDRAESDGERAAWLAGQPYRSQSRSLLLKEIVGPPDEWYAAVRSTMYEDVRQFWERQCRL